MATGGGAGGAAPGEAPAAAAGEPAHPCRGRKLSAGAVAAHMHEGSNVCVWISEHITHAPNLQPADGAQFAAQMPPAGAVIRVVGTALSWFCTPGESSGAAALDHLSFSLAFSRLQQLAGAMPASSHHSSTPA